MFSALCPLAKPHKYRLRAFPTTQKSNPSAPMDTQNNPSVKFARLLLFGTILLVLFQVSNGKHRPCRSEERIRAADRMEFRSSMRDDNRRHSDRPAYREEVIDDTASGRTAGPIGTYRDRSRY